MDFAVPHEVNVLTSRTPAHAGTVRAVQVGLISAMTAELLLLAALAVTVGLSTTGWAVGIASCVITNAALAVGFAHYRSDRLGPAEWVTLTRATLAVGIAALVADSFEQPASVTTLVTLSFLALALDAVDGYVARRTGTASALGAKFDGEVDAFLILVLSVYVASTIGPWVIVFGAARYLYAVGEWVLRVDARAAAAPVLAQGGGGDVRDLADRRGLGRAATPGDDARADRRAGGAGRVVRARRVWLWRRRDAPSASVVPTPAGDVDAPPPGAAGAGRCGRRSPALLTALALLVVWFALVAPDNIRGAPLDAFARIPLEGLLIVGLATLLPRTCRRVRGRAARLRARPDAAGEAARHGVPGGLRPPVQPGRGLELHQARHRDAA